MADEKIVTSIVANSDFSNLIADVQRVTGSLSKLQQEFAGANRALAGQINAANSLFSDTMRKTGQFSTHFVSLTSDVEKFGRNLDSGRLKLKDYFRVYQENVRTSGGLIRDLAKQQVQLQNAVLQPLGRNAQGLMQYNVHIPRGLDLTKNKASLLKQELQIMNKVIQDGGVQLINWGKNTQWAGRQLTVGLTLPLAAFGKAAADAFKVADQELTRLTKVYGDIAGTSAQDLGKIRKEVAQTAKELSATMGVNFTETIGLAADIAATGKTGNELLSSIKETTRLAVLGEVDRQEAMKATLAIQSAFKQNTEDLSKSINFLNAVENQTSTTLNDLVEAIPKAGPVIEGLGGSVQDLALYLTAMREGGINASEGANALKSALASLINPTDVAVAKFQSFGIDLLGIVQKNAGNTTETLFALQAALDRLNPLQKQQAIEQLFGKFQFSRLNALFENLGRQGSQTLKVLDLMKASAGELEAVAGRELAQVTESASGRYRRALETLKAELAGVGDQFLDIGTKLINVLSKVLDFAQKLPDPIKKLLAFGGAFTAIIGPVIMLTGVLANFFGYIIKGLGHFKALFKGAEGFKLLTPEIMAAKAASSQLADEFYSDALAADTLSSAIKKLNNDLKELRVNAETVKGGGTVGQVVSTIAGTPIITMGGKRIVDPEHPLVGGESRAAAHINPRNPKDPASIFGLTMQPIPVNRKIGRTPQIMMTERLPDIEGLTSVGGVSTGVVAGEHARYAALMATLGVQSKQEIEQLKQTIGLGGQVSKEFIDTFDDILPITQRLTQNAAAQSAAIVADLRAGKLNVEQARAAIIAANADLERMMGAEITAYAASRGRTIDLTKAPLIDQPVVDVAGKPNTRGMFRKGIFGKVMRAVGRATQTRTYGGPYSIETTKPQGLNTGGSVFYNNGDQVPGPNVNADVVPAMLTPGEFVIRRDVAQQDPDGMRALNEGRAMIVPTFNRGGQIPGVQYRFGGGGIANVLQRIVQSGLRGRQYRAKALLEDAGIPVQRLQNSVYPARHGLANLRSRGGAPVSASAYLDEFNDPNVFVMTNAVLKRSKLDTITPEQHKSISAYLSQNIDPKGLITESEFGRQLTLAYLNAGLTREQLKAIAAKNTMRFAFPGAGSIVERRDSLIAQLKQRYPEGKFEIDKNSNNNIIVKMPGVPAFKIEHEATRNLSALGPSYETMRQEIPAGIRGNERLAYAHLPLDESLFLNSGGMVPGYFGGQSIRGLPQPIISRITKKWGSVYGGDSLSNEDPLHGPLRIGRFQPPRPTRVGRKGASIEYKRPGATSNTSAFLTGSLEDRGRYVTQEYMLGNYDVLKIPGAIQAMKAWGKKASGKFYRGIRLSGFAGGPKPLPDWLMDDIKKAQATGDFSNLIGKEFIMRRSSWSANPEIAKEFGTFNIVANVKNRRVTPVSEMFPEIGFAPKSAKTKQEKIKRARTEEESVFGGKFRIVRADKNGLELETAFGPLAGNRAFGGQVNAGMPYVVGENGPELFVPKNSGGIIPKYNIGGKVPYGYARGIQRRIDGGTILKMLAMFGLPMVGQEAGNRIGGAAGSAVSTASFMAPMFMMGSGFGGKPPISAGQRLGTSAAEPISWARQSIFAKGGMLGGFTARVGEAATVGTGLEKVLGRIALSFTRFNVIVATVVVTVKALYDIWKKYSDAQKRVADSFGMSEQQAKKAGLSYQNLGSQVKTAVENSKAMAERNKLVYESLTMANTPLSLTIEQYKKLKQQVKDTMPEVIDNINKMNNAQAKDYAVQLKTQFMAYGDTVEEATKKVYALFAASDKKFISGSVIAQKAFADIKNSADAAAAAIDLYGKSLETGNIKAQANAVDTALQAINIAVKNTMDSSKGQLNFYEAMNKTLDEINSKVSNQKRLTEETILKLREQNPELGNILNKTDNIVSAWAKYQLLLKGINLDLASLNANQAIAVNNAVQLISQNVSQSLISNKGILADENKLLKDKEAQYKKLELAARGEKVQVQINRRDRIKALEEEIKKINEAADARKKALQQEAEDQDINIEIQKKRLEYQQKLAAGDMAGAAQAQLDLQKVIGTQQKTITERAIEEKRAADIAPLQAEIDKLNAAANAQADAAALAGESMQSLAKEIARLKTTIADVTSSILAIVLGKIFDPNFENTAAGKAAFAALKKLLADTGNVPQPNKPAAQSPDQAKAEYESGKPKTATSPEEAKSQYESGKEKPKTKTPTEIGMEWYDAVAGGIEKGLQKNPLVIKATNVVIETGAVSGAGTAGSPINLGNKAATSQINPIKLSTWNGTSGATGTREMVKSYAQSRGILPGQYFSMTDEKGKQYTFRMREDGNITMVKDPYAKMAGGGAVSGPGTSTSDSIPAYLSDGEYVVRADAVKHYGVGTFDALNAKKFKDGGNIKKKPGASFGMSASLPSVSKEDKALQNFMKEKRKELEVLRAVIRQNIDNYTPPNLSGNSDEGAFGGVKRVTPEWIQDKFRSGYFDDWYKEKYGKFPQSYYSSRGYKYTYEIIEALEYEKYLAQERIKQILNHPDYKKGMIKGFKEGGEVKGQNWFQRYVSKLSSTQDQMPAWARDPFGMSQILRKFAGQGRQGDKPGLMAALLPLNFVGSGIGKGASATINAAKGISSTKASTTIIRNLRKAMIESAINSGRAIPSLSMTDHLKTASSMFDESSDIGVAFKKYWGKAYDILVASKNPAISGMSKDDFLKTISGSSEDAMTRWKGTGFDFSGPSASQIDKPSDFIKAANAAYLQAHGLSSSQPLAMFRAVRSPSEYYDNYIKGMQMNDPSLTPEQIMSTNIAHELGGYWSLNSRMAASYLRNLGLSRTNLANKPYGGLYRADIPVEAFPTPIGMGGMMEEYANVFNPATIDSLRSATRIGLGWSGNKGPQRYLTVSDFYKTALMPSKGKVAPEVVKKLESVLDRNELSSLMGIMKESSSGRSISLSSQLMRARPGHSKYNLEIAGTERWLEIIKKAEESLGQPLLVPKIAEGGYIGKMHSWNGTVPGPYGKEVSAVLKAGTEGVYQTDYIKSLQNDTMGGAVYNISNTINASADMDIEQISNITTRKTIAAIKQLETVNAGKMGRNRSI